MDNLAALKLISIETLTPGEAPYQSASPDALKQTIQKKTRNYLMPEPVGKVEDITISVPAGQIAGRVYTPSGTGTFPVIVYYHGGGFVIASINAHNSSARALTNGAGAIGVAVD